MSAEEMIPDYVSRIEDKNESDTSFAISNNPYHRGVPRRFALKIFGLGLLSAAFGSSGLAHASGGETILPKKKEGEEGPSFDENDTPSEYVTRVVGRFNEVIKSRVHEKLRHELGLKGKTVPDNTDFVAHYDTDNKAKGDVIFELEYWVDGIKIPMRHKKRLAVSHSALSDRAGGIVENSVEEERTNRVTAIAEALAEAISIRDSLSVPRVVYETGEAEQLFKTLNARLDLAHFAMYIHTPNKEYTITFNIDTKEVNISLMSACSECEMRNSFIVVKGDTRQDQIRIWRDGGEVHFVHVEPAKFKPMMGGTSQPDQSRIPLCSAIAV